MISSFSPRILIVFFFDINNYTKIFENFVELLSKLQFYLQFSHNYKKNCLGNKTDDSIKTNQLLFIISFKEMNPTKIWSLKLRIDISVNSDFILQ